ncbi:FxDxF family PEP-CTERM protein [Pseudoduganella sp. RAF19]|jgi:hypothetical protein|uniref:FxDxF family PEP-CTERM protein n=1 Tax=Pseudoduganella sp. RAF19 TaxID=3233052 RepID=UPI003F9B6BD3
MTYLKQIAAALALTGATLAAHAADISLSPAPIDLTDGVGLASRLITGNNSGNTFADQYTFSLSGVSNVLADVYSFSGNAKNGLDITGFSLFNAAGTLVSSGNQLSTGQTDQWVLDLGKLAADNYYLQVSGSALSKSAGSYTTNLSVSAVPEPATYGMLLGGLAVLGLATARRRKQQ